MPRDMDYYLSPETVDEDEARALAQGQILAEAINTPDTAINVMMDAARHDYLGALKVLIDVDLKTTEGIATALKAQAEAQRYRTLIRWIRDQVYRHDAALAKSEGVQPIEEGSAYS